MFLRAWCVPAVWSHGAVPRRPTDRERDASSASDSLLGPHPIDTGTAEIVRDLDRPSTVVLLVNGVPSSVHDLDDPGLLDFDYLRWIALAVRTRYPVGAAASRLDVLHLGAGGCSLARHLADALPGSRHLAVEIDAALAEGVRRWFPLPTAPVLRIRVGDARAVTASLSDHSRDVVVRDVFAGAVTPAALTTVEFTREVRRTLRPDGLYLANSIGVLGEIHGELGTLASVFPYVAVIAHASTLRDRQRGNLILAASDSPFVTPALRGALLRDRTPAQLRDRDDLGAVVDVRRALHDAAHGGWSAP